MNDLIKQFKLSFLNLIDDKSYTNVDYRFNGTVGETILDKAGKIGFDEDLIAFYRRTDGFEAEWDYDLDKNLLGRMKILEINSVLKSWENYLCGPNSDPRLKNFKPIDFFTEEACCGMVLDGTGDKSMYYHYLGDNEIYPLDIDFKSYFEIAIDAKVMFYWQTYLVNLITPLNQRISFPEKVKELFPDFDLDAFTAKFERLRLSKQ